MSPGVSRHARSNCDGVGGPGAPKPQNPKTPKGCQIIDKIKGLKENLNTEPYVYFIQLAKLKAREIRVFIQHSKSQQTSKLAHQ